MTAAVELEDRLAEVLPTDDEVAEYRERGWYISRPIFDDRELEAAIDGSERFYRGEVIEPERVRVPDWVRPTTTYDGLRKHDYADFLCPQLRALVVNPLLGAVAARLAGVEEIRLWHTQLLYKPSEEPAPDGAPVNVGWHTDRHYWLTSSSERMLTAWIPFHDVDETTGTITMIDRSCHFPDNTEGLSFFDQDLDVVEERFRTGGAPIVKVPMTMARGQVSFHSMLTIHGSGPNRSGRPRRSMAVHLQPGDNRWRWHLRRKGDELRVAVHANDLIVPQTGPSGVPDYADPDWFPVLHPRR
jgi:hypothetical protein